MCTVLPEPTDLRDDPELAVLVILKINLRIAERSLLAAYPDLDYHDLEARRSHTAQDAYASALVYHIRALAATVEEYVESSELLRTLKNQRPPAHDITF
jgi:hypothetical protein